MDRKSEERARKMVEALDQNSGFLIQQGTVVLRCLSASSPTEYDDTPMMSSNEEDLKNATELGIVEETTAIHWRNGKPEPGWKWFKLKTA